MLRYSTLLLIPLALLSSCASTTSTSPTPATSEFVQAKAGSTFTFDEYSSDSMGMAVAGSRESSVFQSTNGGMSWA